MHDWSCLIATADDLLGARSVAIAPSSSVAVWDAVWSACCGRGAFPAGTRRFTVLADTGHLVALLALSPPSSVTRRALMRWVGVKHPPLGVFVCDAHVAVLPPYALARGDALVLYALVYSDGLRRLRQPWLPVALRLVSGHQCTGDEFPADDRRGNPLVRVGATDWFLRLAPNAESVLTGETENPLRYRGNAQFTHYWRMRWAQWARHTDGFDARAAHARAELLARLGVPVYNGGENACNTTVKPS